MNNQNFEVNKPHPSQHYDEKFVLNQEAYIYTSGYWDNARPDSISKQEEQTYAMIDSIRQIRGVRIWTDVLSTMISGYKTVGKVDIGHILNTYAYNNVEGHRLELGFRTNTDFSSRYILRGFLAYGSRDQKLKYGLDFNYFLSRKNWAFLGVSRSENIDRMGVSSDDFRINPLVSSVLRWGNLEAQGPYRREQTAFFAQADLIKGLTQRIELRNYQFRPLLDNFAFYLKPNEVDSPVIRTYTNSDIIFETRLARQEEFVYPGNDRVSLGTRRLPILTFRYTWGLSNFLHSDLNYHKFEMNLEQNLRLGIFGRTRYQVSAGLTPSTLPISLLFVPIGNRSFVYNYNGFNLLDFLEFTNDRYAMLNLEHNFEGLIANRLPLLRKLKLRTLFITKPSSVVYAQKILP
ncbi:MAG: hypothetical protein HC880_12075 [Bacteroidia bacterium]|nr:hypothetical protein [Bacteroidia bacterium]